MNRRKNIALFTALPEAAHERRVIKGMIGQCLKYDYNLLVFCAMTHAEFNRRQYARGESNIYSLANFDHFDGVVIDTTNIFADRAGRTLKMLKDEIGRHSGLPAVALEMSIDGLKLISNRNEEILREMCRHVIDVHGKKDICILTGQKGNEVAESRLEVFLDEISRHGLKVSEEHIVYGDFWYTGGDRLARDIASGRISKPDAVICASDHMAIGLIERLRRSGFEIPEDLIVVSFDTVDEGRWCEVVLSSFDANDACAAASAVDYIRSCIEPDKELLPYDEDISRVFNPGMSCGCATSVFDMVNTIRHNIHSPSYNLATIHENQTYNIGMLMESYVFESFTGTGTPDECLGKICDSVYLLKPFLNYRLCLKDSWLNPDDGFDEGYPDRMRIVVSSDNAGKVSYGTLSDKDLFDIGMMIPLLFEPHDEPSVYFFSPVHFNGSALGYSVLNRSMVDYQPVDLVYRNWLRFVNNALEMTRSKNQLLNLSAHDAMTGMYNRRGMETGMAKLFADADKDESIYVSVIDMDGLKSVNDNYGHKEGDFSLKTLSRAIYESAEGNEICVRAGGDEFFVIGIGNYSDDVIESRIARFEEILEEMNARSNKPYKITASIGCVIRDYQPGLNIDQLLGIADREMYEYKIAHKRQRE